jgi:hypothetical protein
MRNVDAAFSFLTVISCLAIAGCERAEHGEPAATTSTHSLADLKSKTPVRYLCTYCSAWREADPVKLIVSLTEGAKPGSEDEKAVAGAKVTEAPFMVRHLEKCGRNGGMIVAVYPDDPRWRKLDPKKREN